MLQQVTQTMAERGACKDMGVGGAVFWTLSTSNKGLFAMKLAGK